ncbi:MAG: class I SAM-dependent methyltransferase [Candidatus Eremiobacteraeota bacterium]|nr:class I SAM-dependent methyltransferase [Candidatus Eremiobacteraeota bacterium]
MSQKIKAADTAEPEMTFAGKVKKSFRQTFFVPWLKARAKRLGTHIIDSTENCSSLLDFGCGDAILTEFLHSKSSKEVVGVDTVDTNLSRIPVVIYDGERLPFADKHFDAALVAYALHHCQNVGGILNELKRVTRKKIIIIEEIYRSRFSQKLLHFHDYGNRLLSSKMDIPLNFHTMDRWTELFRNMDFLIHKTFRIYQYPLFNITHQVLFELHLDDEIAA